MTDEDKQTTAMGLFNFAESYWRSANALEKANLRVTHPNSPICFLYYHAMELYLKSHFRACGYSVKTLRTKFGHDLCKLANTAKEQGLHFDDEDTEVLTYWATQTAVMRSRYISAGYFKIPANEALDRTCKSLRVTIGGELRENGINVRL